MVRTLTEGATGTDAGAIADGEELAHLRQWPRLETTLELGEVLPASWNTLPACGSAGAAVRALWLSVLAHRIVR